MARFVRLDKIRASAHIESIVATEDLLDGQWLQLGALQYDGEAYAATPSGNQGGDEYLVFHASNGLIYDQRQNELDFVLKAGKAGRAFVVETGNVISISEDGIAAGNPAIGATVIPHADGFAVGAAPEGSGISGRVIAHDYDENAGRLIVIRLTVR